jgi:hydroxyethylthiazole kinase-like uncharacterized protein yjeF
MSRALEQQAQAGLAPHTLMRRAGVAVARLAIAIAPHAQRVWIAAGPGNNGGDGLEAAVLLKRAGRDVRVTLCGDAARLPPDAGDALARAQAAGVAIGDTHPSAFTRTLAPHDLAIDALLGLGVSRAPQGPLAALIDELNALACPVLAVDLPSGLDAHTGQALGGVCVNAAHTLALLTLKPGLYTGHGRDLSGTVWFDDLGVDPGAAAPDAWLIGDAAARAGQAPRRHAQHKGSFGDVAVVGGAPGMTGAALLAGRAALASGAGRVFVNLLGEEASLPSALLNSQPTLDMLRPELMFRPAWWQGDPGVIGSTTVVCGCGGGEAVRAALPRLLSLAPRLVLDADALNAVASDAALQAQLLARAARGHATVLTPHPLEAARLLGGTAREVQADRLRSAQMLAERFRCAVLLKGSGSIVAAPGQVPCINPTGNASLATAGTGDVLAGWLGGLWAQDGRPEHAFDIAAAAAHTHGAAADAAGVSPLRAADLVEWMLSSHRAVLPAQP